MANRKHSWNTQFGWPIKHIPGNNLEETDQTVLKYAQLFVKLCLLF